MTTAAGDSAHLIPEQRRELIVKHLRREQVLSFPQLASLLDGAARGTPRGVE